MFTFAALDSASCLGTQKRLRIRCELADIPGEISTPLFAIYVSPRSYTLLFEHYRRGRAALATQFCGPHIYFTSPNQSTSTHPDAVIIHSRSGARPSRLPAAPLPLPPPLIPPPLAPCHCGCRPPVHSIVHSRQGRQVRRQPLQ